MGLRGGLSDPASAVISVCAVIPVPFIRPVAFGGGTTVVRSLGAFINEGDHAADLDLVAFGGLELNGAGNLGVSLGGDLVGLEVKEGLALFNVVTAGYMPGGQDAA